MKSFYLAHVKISISIHGTNPGKRKRALGLLSRRDLNLLNHFLIDRAAWLLTHGRHGTAMQGYKYSSGPTHPAHPRRKGYGVHTSSRLQSSALSFFTVVGVLLLVLLNVQKWQGAEQNGRAGVRRDGSLTYGIQQHQDGSAPYLVAQPLSQSELLSRTLVLYVYNAEDEEQERSFAFFLRYGITDGPSSPTYRIIISDGPNVKPFPRLPSLPSNAAYLKTSLCTTTWGAIDAVYRALDVQEYDYFVVVDSQVRGPFVPPYVTGLHWTEAFTRKLVKDVKMVGSIISCEGAAKDGDAAGEWRGNPYVKSHAWATDAEGLARMVAQQGIFRCHKNRWDTRYHSDAGASLAMFKSGWTIDTLMSRYQGIDWKNTDTWQCNQRVPPDLENHYDGISLNPYEVVFVPVKSAYADARWSFVEQADRYEKWLDMHLRQGEAVREVHNNAWITKHWTYKRDKLVTMNSRGPECFDFEYYVKSNPELVRMKGDDMALWEHFLLLGQFQAKNYRFTCPMNIGNSYRIAYVLSRGSRCFDHEYYAQQHSDLAKAGFDTKELLFEHFAEFGQFEKRKVRFTCADTMIELPRGFDTLDNGHVDGVSFKMKKEDAQETEMRKAAIQRAAMLRQRGDANDEVTQAIKGALVEEAALDTIRLKSRGKTG